MTTYLSLCQISKNKKNFCAVYDEILVPTSVAAATYLVNVTNGKKKKKKALVETENDHCKDIISE